MIKYRSGVYTMKKGLLTTLLLASGAALAVYLLSEEQNKRVETEDEVRMIKLRSDEEDKELVKTIQEIENLPLKNIQDVEQQGAHQHEEEQEESNFIELDDLSDMDIPSFREMAPIAAEIIKPAVKATEEILEDLRTPLFHEEIEEEPEVISNFEDIKIADENEDLQKLIQDIEASTDNLEQLSNNFNEDEDLEDLLEDLVVPTFVERVKPTGDIKLETLMHPFGSPVIEPEEIIPSVETSVSIEEEPELDEFDTFEIPAMVQSIKPDYAEEDLSRTAIFDLPKFAHTEEPTIKQSQDMTLRNPFGDDDLEELDLASLFEDLNPIEQQVSSPIFSMPMEETSELKLVDLDEEEIQKLFATDDHDLEEISIEPSFSEAPQLKKELTEDEFEEFKKRLIHVGEDDVDLINLNDANPFETVEPQHSEEVDIINFGNIVEEPTVALEDLVLARPIETIKEVEEEIDLPSLDEIEDEEEIDLSSLDEIQDEEEVDIAPFAMMEDTAQFDIPTLNPFDEEDELEEISIPSFSDSPREYPDAVYDISTLYPFLNLKFINAIFNNFEAFNEEFEVGSRCRITHKVQFPDSQNLISFIEIIKEYGYEINGTDENHNILVYLDFDNQESKILSEIYNISNQVNCLDGLYKGYELEHI